MVREDLESGSKGQNQVRIEAETAQYYDQNKKGRLYQYLFQTVTIIHVAH